MKNVLILGAHGQIAQIIISRLLDETTDHLSLYLRNAERLNIPANDRLTIIEADVNDAKALNEAMRGQDIVYANLGGKFEPMLRNIVDAMERNNVSRLVHVTGLGLYHEVPGEFGDWVERTVGKDVMNDTRRAAAIIENSVINYTILRCAYMTNEDVIEYELTEKVTPFKGTIISRKSIADLIVKVVKNPQKHEYASLGISQPKTDGDRPVFPQDN
jgi:uncharacterized protein YbjT (DUF2867 family)